MDTWSVLSGVVLATLLCLAILVTATLWKKNRPGGSRQPNYRLFFLVGLVMVPIALVELFVFWRLDMPFVVSLPLLAIGMLFLVIGIANRDNGRGGK